ncbi:MAG TPA: HlyD family efflux transporter periplasmic adaptor subunit [Pyrinomonadaceae bacterium]|jgi:HlyD family secretion protein|nr:HlyD family efflux transporter periplasmic adaptor subunit [Pyrinomonadaceae bacterium]
MDIKRPPKSKLKKKIRTAVMIVVGLAAIGGITYGLTKLKPAAPTIDPSTVVIDTVKRGEMVRDVRGNGTLVPEVTRWVPAPAEGRVENIPIQAGAVVDPSTVIAELSNPQMEQQATDAEFQVKAAEADAENLKVKLESDTMTQKSAIATINSQYSQAKMQLDADESLAKQGLVADLTLKISRVAVQDLANRLKVEQERLAVAAKSTKAQLNAASSRLQQLRVMAKLRRDQVDALKVRAGTAGVLQQVSVQVGQQVTPGLNIARVADPASLKAVLRVAETTIKDVRIGQTVLVDTRNGIIQGTVSRIDPAAREGTFEVDASLIGPLPSSARPDLSVDGTIELERLKDVLKVGRPAFGQANQTIGMFVLTPDGSEAVRTSVKLGRNSVSTIEVLEGLKEGDRVIISDTSAHDSYNRIRIR